MQQLLFVGSCVCSYLRPLDVEGPRGGSNLRACPGGNPLIKERILATDSASGVATRILRYEPGADSTAMGVQRHDFWRSKKKLARWLSVSCTVVRSE